MTEKARPDRLLWVPWLAIVASLLVRIAFWFGRDFNHDDFFAAYIGSMRALGAKPGVDFYLPNFTPAGELLTPLFRWFPESFLPLDIARAFMLLFGLLLLWICWRLTRDLGGSPAAAALVVLVVTWQSDFAARIADIRAEPLAALFLLASTLAMIRRRFAWSGFFFGLALALTYKYVVAGPFVVIGLLFIARRRLRPYILFAGLAMVGPLAYYGWRLAADGQEVFLSVLHEIAAGSIASGSNKSFYLGRTFSSSWFSLLLIAGGLVATTSRYVRRREDSILFIYSLLATAFALVYLAAIPFIFPYTAVLLVPILAPLAAGLSPFLSRLPGRFAQGLSIAAVSTCVVFQGLPSTVMTTQRTGRHQRQVVQWIWQHTSPSDHVFDWQGMHFGRRGIFHWYQFGALRDRYERGWYSLADEWRRYEVHLLIEDFRFGYMKRSDVEFLSTHFVRIDPCLFAPGRIFSGGELQQGATFEAVTSGSYQTRGGPLLIDGRAAGEWTTLGAGTHTISRPGAADAGPAGLVLMTPAASRDPLPCHLDDEPLLYGFD